MSGEPLPLPLPAHAEGKMGVKRVKGRRGVRAASTREIGEVKFLCHQALPCDDGWLGRRFLRWKGSDSY